MHTASEGLIKITKTTIDSAWRRRAANHRLIIRDKDCRGLALIVNSTAMSWSYAYRPRGIDGVTGKRWPNRTVTIGNPTTHSPDDARLEATRIKGQTAAGADPAAERKLRVAEEQRKRGTTLRRLIDGYESALPTRPKMRGDGLPSAKYVSEELSQLRLALADMDANDLPATDLGPANVRRLIERASAIGAATARARFGSLSRFLDWCQDAGHVQANPCVLIARSRRPRASRARSYYLTVESLARLWRAADELREPVWRDLVRFLIAMPCRRGEAARLDWAHLDLAAAEWRQPSHMTKNRDPHRLHLHPLALEILSRRHHALTKARDIDDHKRTARIVADDVPRSGLVFPAPVSGRVVDTFSDLRLALVKATGQIGDDVEADELTGWTWHDFRRSFASALGEAAIPESVADAVLNHRQAATRGGVLGVYQRSSRWPEQMRAMQLWGQLLSDALSRNAPVATVGSPLST